MTSEMPNRSSVQIIRPTFGETRNEPLDATGVMTAGAETMA
jgi:hypothetical protein